MGAEQGITGNSGLGAVSSISCSYVGIRGRSIPSRLAARPLTSKPGGSQLLRASNPIGKILRHLHGTTTEGVD